MGVAQAISPIMPISTFGIYAALCIVANFFFVITLTPPAVMIHHDYFGGVHSHRHALKASNQLFSSLGPPGVCHWFH